MDRRYAKQINGAARLVRTLEALASKGHNVADDLTAARQVLAMLAGVS